MSKEDLVVFSLEHGFKHLAESRETTNVSLLHYLPIDEALFRSMGKSKVGTKLLRLERSQFV
jgi:hypothetical protein